jgi:riboflavin kinase / FMN adenylyltransferase
MIIRGIVQLKTSPTHAVVTIGNFDGVHLGHQHILKTAVEKAKARGGKSIAFTFNPHPRVALNPGSDKC